MSDRVISPYRTIPPAPTTINESIEDHEAASDPHTPYLRADGTRALTGNQSIGGFKLTNIADAIEDTDAPSYGQIRRLIANRDPQDAVISKTTDIPVTPTNGDRYIIPSDATGVWIGLDNQVAERVAGVWEYYIPSEGWELRVQDDNKQWIYDGVTWIDFGTVIDHGILGGIGDDDHTQYLLAGGSRAGGSAVVQAFTQGITIGDGTTGHINISPGAPFNVTSNVTLPSAKYAYILSAGSDVVTNGSTTIADGITAGQCVEYINVSNKVITFIENAKTALPSATNFNLSPNESIRLRWSGSQWRCIGYHKNTIPLYIGGSGISLTPTVQVLTGGGTIAYTTGTALISAASAITLSSTMPIAAPLNDTNGLRLEIINTGSYPISFPAGYASSIRTPGSSTIVIPAYGHRYFQRANSKWYTQQNGPYMHSSVEADWKADAVAGEGTWDFLGTATSQSGWVFANTVGVAPTVMQANATGLRCEFNGIGSQFLTKTFAFDVPMRDWPDLVFELDIDATGTATSNGAYVTVRWTDVVTTEYIGFQLFTGGGLQLFNMISNTYQAGGLSYNNAQSTINWIGAGRTVKFVNKITPSRNAGWCDITTANQQRYITSYSAGNVHWMNNLVSSGVLSLQLSRSDAAAYAVTVSDLRLKLQ